MTVEATRSNKPPAPKPSAEAESFVKLLRRLPQPAMLSDRDGTIVAINRAGLALLQADSEALVVGRNHSSFLVAETRNEAAAAYQALIGGSMRQPELLASYDLITLKGNRRTIEVTALPLMAPGSDEFELVLGLARDVTQEVSLERERALLAAIVESSEDAIITKAPDYTIRTWNAGAQRLYGYTADEVIGKPVTILIGADQTGELKQLVDRVLSGEKIKDFETRRRRKDGTLIDVSLSESPVRDAAGQVVGIAAIERDISERVRTRNLEAQLASIVKFSTEAIYSLGPGHIVQTWNAGAERMLGYRAAEVIGQRSRTMIPECQAQLDEMLARVLAGETVHFESKRRRKDGVILDVAVTASPIFDNAGKVSSLAIITRDITERKRAERALLKTQEQLRARMRQQAGVARLSHQALGKIEVRVLMADAAALAAQTLEADLCVIAELLPDGKSLARRAIYGSAGGCAPATIDKDADDHAAFILRCREPIIVSDFATETRFHRSALLDGADAISGFSVTIPDSECAYGIIALSCKASRDFSRDDVNFVEAIAYILGQVLERRRAEHELRRARDQALESARAKSAFLANMSHEIRTPLNSIVGLSGLLLDSKLNAEQQEFAEIIRLSSDVLLETINNVLDFSKISTGKTVLEKTEFDPRVVIQTAIDLLASAAQAKQLKLTSLVDADVPRILRGDPGRLRQILVNLLGNALKFTAAGEVALKVSVQSESDNAAGLYFAVSDTGIGISAETQRRLFEPFSQADSSTTRKFGGSGLGLAICKQLVDLMGGQIGVRSRPGEGATFWFAVALEKAPISALAPEHSGQLQAVRALVVDDGAINRQIARRQMESWGMRVVSAESGAQALALLRRQAATDPYAIALVDLQMPGIDGLELAARIKADPGLAQIRLVMMSSGGPPPSDDPRAKLFDAWLVKPVRPPELLRCLSSLALGHQQVTPPAAQVKTMEAPSAIRILLAEDNPVNQKVAMIQLKKLGYEPQVVGNGREALEALKQSHYDLVLMDCQMPEMDGYEATREIRRMEAQTSQHTIVIAMTAFGLSGDREKCLEAGMDDYLAKPIKAEHLREMLERWKTPNRLRTGLSANSPS
jgi:PAS domain S-box-containing protein